MLKNKTILRTWRRGFALKQKEVASLLGKRGITYVSKVEKGHLIPTLRDAVLYEILTGEDLKFLFPEVHHDAEEKIRVNAKKFLTRIKSAEGEEYVLKRDLLSDILIRITKNK